jgi:NTP pyrophosphatase (non-canonical NTP hydrolase)
MDFKTIMEELINLQDDKDWSQFLKSEKLLKSLREATNLLEAYQYDNNTGKLDLVEKYERDQIKERLAEIIIYIFYLCFNLDISCNSLEVAMYSKLIKDSNNFQLLEQKEHLKNVPSSKVIELKRKE